MDIFILLATMIFCFLIGMPIAYSLATAAIVGAMSLGIPLEAVMLKISDGSQQSCNADNSVFCAGGRDHGRMAAWRTTGCVRERAGRLYQVARRPFDRQRDRDYIPQAAFQAQPLRTLLPSAPS